MRRGDDEARGDERYKGKANLWTGGSQWVLNGCRGGQSRSRLMEYFREPPHRRGKKIQLVVFKSTRTNPGALIFTFFYIKMTG